MLLSRSSPKPTGEEEFDAYFPWFAPVISPAGEVPFFDAAGDRHTIWMGSDTGLREVADFEAILSDLSDIRSVSVADIRIAKGHIFAELNVDTSIPTR